MMEDCHGLWKTTDGCLTNVGYAVDPDISKRTLDTFDYRNSSYKGLRESEYFENSIVFGVDTEFRPKLV